MVYRLWFSALQFFSFSAFPLDDGQALAAFAAAGREYLAAASGGFAGAVPDFARALFAVWAEGRLHGFSVIKR
jgi:hypothetical protein